MVSYTRAWFGFYRHGSTSSRGRRIAEAGLDGTAGCQIHRLNGLPLSSRWPAASAGPPPAIRSDRPGRPAGAHGMAACEASERRAASVDRAVFVLTVRRPAESARRGDCPVDLDRAAVRECLEGHVKTAASAGDAPFAECSDSSYGSSGFNDGDVRRSDSHRCPCHAPDACLGPVRVPSRALRARGR